MKLQLEHQFKMGEKNMDSKQVEETINRKNGEKMGERKSNPWDLRINTNINFRSAHKLTYLLGW